MEKTITTTPATVAPKKETAAKDAKPAKTPRAAPAPKVHAHREAGVKADLYTGMSGMFNNNRKTAVMEAPARPTSTLTERHQKALYALRGAYADKPFPAKGFDNGILRDLRAAGLITLNGGVTENIDGKVYHLDGTTPVMVKITKEGAAYGRA